MIVNEGIFMISNQIANLKGSSTAEFLKLAKEREKQGYDIIHLEIGQPDFQPLPQIIDSTIKAIKEGKTTYTISSCIPELRHEISDFYSEDFNLQINAESEILVTASAKLGVLASIFTILNDDDQLLVPEPYWVSYPDMTKLARGKFTAIPMTEDFSLNQDHILEASNNTHSKAILINSPNNPSGHVLTNNELRFLKDLIEDKNFFIVSDEIYNEYIYVDTSTRTLLKEFDDWRSNVIVINGNIDKRLGKLLIKFSQGDEKFY
jgi:aspartate aminotransferase